MLLKYCLIKDVGGEALESYLNFSSIKKLEKRGENKIIN